MCARQWSKLSFAAAHCCHSLSLPDLYDVSEGEITCTTNILNLDRDSFMSLKSKSEPNVPKRRCFVGNQLEDLELSLTPFAGVKLVELVSSSKKQRRDRTPSINSKESGTTSNCFESRDGFIEWGGVAKRQLRLWRQRGEEGEGRGGCGGRRRWW